MRYIQGQDRNQISLFPVTLDEAISNDNQVRDIDAFVDGLNIDQMGFKCIKKEERKADGRPSYQIADLLKLYIYGYLNKTRSSRELEKETHRNIELMWLLRCLTPDHNTISNFRKDNPEAIRKVFHATVQTALNLNLIGGTIIAGDSVKLRAQNSKKNNYNQDKIDRHIEYIDNKLAEHNAALEQADEPQKEEIKKQIIKHQTRKEGYQELEKQLKATSEAQISTSDTESKQLPIRQGITEVAYSTQTINDAKSKMILDFEVTNRIDNNALSGMVQRAINITGNTNFWALFDKGYHTGAEIRKCHELGVLNTLISIPKSSNSSTPDPKYHNAYFTYLIDNDHYICPQNQILTSNGTWYDGKAEPFKVYRSTACKECEVRAKCTASPRGRAIQRNESALNVLRNKENMEQNMEIYKQRQAIVEHPFGTIKRNWGFDYIMTKQGKQRASADVGLILIAYNLRRLLTLTKGKLREALNLLLIHILQRILSQNKPSSKNMTVFKHSFIKNNKPLLAA